jgi:signal transduction histidine kinase
VHDVRVETRGDRRLRLAAAGVAVLSLLMCAAAVMVWLAFRRRGIAVETPHTADLVLGSLFPVAGAVVLWRQPRNACGWVLLSAGLVGVSALAHAWTSAGTTDPGSLPLVPLAVWLSAWTYTPYWLQSSLLPVLFPDGRLSSTRWKRYVRAVLWVYALLVVVAMLKPDDDVEGLGQPNPLGVGPDSWMAGWAVLQYGSVMALFFVATPIALVGMVLRTRRAAGRERAQLLWLLLGLSSLPLYAVLSQVLPVLGGELGFALAFACIPVSLGIAVLRHSLLDIEVVVHRTVAYVLLTAGGVASYVALVALAGRYATSDGVGPLIAGAVVAAAAAGRTRMQSLVDRRLFGSRRDPYAVVQAVTAATAAAQEPGAALTALVQAVRETLRLPFVQVLDDSGEVVAETGAPVAGTHVVPVVDAGRQRGVLVVGRRSARERLRTEEASALVDVAHRAGSLLHARALTADLRRSYEQVLEVREQERLRLRRDLHDGVGPSLAGVALQLEGLAGQLTDQPALAARAERARGLILATVGDVRRIVDGLRPAAVEDLGLERALRQLATRADDPVQVLVEVDLAGELDPATEVAVYRIVGEAVTNALRHAAASTVQVCVTLDENGVRVEVSDDGTGIAVPSQRGVGLQSMHDRADELGGRLDIGPGPDGGTRLVSWLPVDST